MSRDPLRRARLALAAASSAAPDVALMYLATARAALTTAQREIGEIDLILTARERALVATSPAAENVAPAPDGERGGR